MKNNKKGISAVVATVLIILITVAAVTVIWAAIIPMISENIGGATECFDASAALTINSDYSCYNESGNYVNIQVARSTGDFELLGVDVSGSWEGNSAVVTYNVTDVPDANGERVYVIDLGIADDELDLDGIDGASVAARVKAGQVEKLCDGSAITEIRACQ